MRAVDNCCMDYGRSRSSCIISLQRAAVDSRTDAARSFSISSTSSCGRETTTTFRGFLRDSPSGSGSGSFTASFVRSKLQVIGAIVVGGSLYLSHGL